MPSKRHCAGLFLTLVFALTLGCGATPLPHEVIERGSAAMQTQEPTFAVIENASQWGDFYRRIHAHRLPPPPTPEVDWDRNLAIFVAAGWKPSSGYAVELERVERKGATLEVKVRFIAPPADSVRAAVMTQPYLVALVEKTPGLETVKFLDSEGEALGQVGLEEKR